MRTRLLIAALLSLAAAAPAAAQPATADPDITFVTAAESKALLDRMKAALPADKAMAFEPLVRIPGYRAYVEHRVRPTPAMVHEDEAELFYVMEGSGSMIVGGALTEPKRLNPANVSGAGVSGGRTLSLAKGDFLFVPAGQPHYYAAVGPEGLTVMSLHVPSPRAAP